MASDRESDDDELVTNAAADSPSPRKPEVKRRHVVSDSDDDDDHGAGGDASKSAARMDTPPHAQSQPPPPPLQAVSTTSKAKKQPQYVESEASSASEDDDDEDDDDELEEAPSGKRTAKTASTKPAKAGVTKSPMTAATTTTTSTTTSTTMNSNATDIKLPAGPPMQIGQYMIDINRPVSATQIAQKFKDGLTKAAIDKAITTLVSKEILIKDGSLYWINQALMPNDDNAAELDGKIVANTETQQSLAARVADVQAAVDALVAQPTEADLDKQLTAELAAVKQLETRVAECEQAAQGDPVEFAAKMGDLKAQHVRLAVRVHELTLCRGCANRRFTKCTGSKRARASMVLLRRWPRAAV